MFWTCVNFLYMIKSPFVEFGLVDEHRPAIFHVLERELGVFLQRFDITRVPVQGYIREVPTKVFPPLGGPIYMIVLTLG